MRLKLLFLFLPLFFIGCSYVPTSKFSKEVIARDIYVDINHSVSSPATGIYVSDILRKAVKNRFNLDLSNTTSDATIVYIKSISTSTSKVSYSSDYVYATYLVDVRLHINYLDNLRKEHSFVAEGKSIYSKKVGNSINITKEEEALEKAVNSALNEMVARISSRGM